MNILSTEAKVFTIKCGISQAIQIQDVTWIVIVTNTIPATKRIFDMSNHPYQVHFIGKYKQRSFPNESIVYLYSNLHIKIRTYILHNCKQYQKL